MRANMVDGAITGIYGWAVRLRRDPQCGYRYGPAGPSQVDFQGQGQRSDRKSS